VSPTVVSSYVASGGQLLLLVLWRGTPRWLMKGSHSSSSGVSSDDWAWENITCGNLSWTIEFDVTAHAARVLDQQISLDETNVVLVDRVDTPLGAVVVGRYRVNPELPETGDPALAIIRGHVFLIDYLQCDLAVPDPRVQPVVAMLCRQATGP
jgi:hypothetical protein